MMADSPDFDITAAPLDGVMLIDASAGTGKTYTISSLVIRLLLEKELTIDEILVVTYTDAAVEDLKSRVRQKIIDGHRAFAEGQSEDAFLAALLTGITDHQRALRLLTSALRNFDEAAIFTIHSFCRRVLNEHGLESGVVFDTRLVTDQHDLLKEITEDFFRINFYEVSPLIASYCFKTFAPAELRKKLGSIYAREDVLIIPAGDLEQSLKELELAEKEYRKSFAAMAACWRKDRGSVTDILLSSEALKRNIYRLKSVPAWLAALDRITGGNEAPHHLFKDFIKFTASSLAGAVKKGQTVPEGRFFDLCEDLQRIWLRLQEGLEVHARNLEAGLFPFVRAELKVRKDKAGIHFFDDLLNDLAAALQGAGRDELPRLLRAKYKAAMIDEFQDTDPVQYGIFSRIFTAPGSLLYLIGDPKQAIYSFRGADIFAYIKAVGEVGSRYTLADNYRSVPGLVAAVNAVFAGSSAPFIFEELLFKPAQAAEKDRELLLVDGTEEEAFHLNFFKRNDADRQACRLLNKEDARQQVLVWQTAEICRLLQLGREGRAMIGNRPLAAGDLAILVRTNREARQAQRALARAGVTSVINSSESLFASREAVEVRTLLQAVADGGSRRRVRAALATRILGVAAGDLDLFSENESLLADWLEKFRGYHDLWFRKGFATMFSTFLEREKVNVRLLSLPDGERSLTNVLHLLEVLHIASEEHGLGIAGLIKYLGERIASIDEQPTDEQQLRLDSDADLVQIVTIHKSKGLQYQIVFCPFCWEGSRLAGKGKKSRAYLFHDPEEQNVLKLDIGSPEQESSRRHAIREEMAENLRLLYVALTRAVQRCYLAWGPFSGGGSSALAYLLHGWRAEDELPWAGDNLAGLDDDQIVDDLKQLVARSGQAICLNSSAGAPAVAVFHPDLQPEISGSRSFSSKLATDWRISSFSSLARQHQSHLLPVVGAGEGFQAGSAPSSGIIGFPRGAAAGTFLHAILEDLDFTSTDQAHLGAFLGERLRSAGYDPVWEQPLAVMIDALFNISLCADDPDLCLAGVGPGDRLTELEFYFPLQDFDPVEIDQILDEWPAGGWSGDKLRGFMKGYIDLVFHHQGKFYIVDWKSNFLGERLEDYAVDNLRAAMAREQYYLQYLIYTVALHRYLTIRLPAYSYEKDFGGVFYVFLRGVDRLSGPATGIFRDKPPVSVIRKLSALFRGPA